MLVVKRLNCGVCLELHRVVIQNGVWPSCPQCGPTEWLALPSLQSSVAAPEPWGLPTWGTAQEEPPYEKYVIVGFGRSLPEDIGLGEPGDGVDWAEILRRLIDGT